MFRGDSASKRGLEKMRSLRLVAATLIFAAVAAALYISGIGLDTPPVEAVNGPAEAFPVKTGNKPHKTL